MSVSKGDKITLAQINDLIDKLNSEASRRGVGTISRLSEGSRIQYSTMKNINDLRVTVSTKYRYTGCDTVWCDTVKTTGTPANWDGRDLTKTVLNPGESVLAQYNKAYASQYNLLLSDIEKLNAMCSCNTYRSSKGSYICGPQTTKTYVDQDGWVPCPEQAGTCGGYEAPCGSVWVPCSKGTEPCTSNGTEPCTSNGTEPCSPNAYYCSANGTRFDSTCGQWVSCANDNLGCSHGTQPCNNGTQSCNNGTQPCNNGMTHTSYGCSCDGDCSCRTNNEKKCEKMVSCPSNCDCEVVSCSGYTEWCDDYCTCHHVCTEYTG